MPDRFKVSPFTNPSGKKVWRVSGTTSAGKRIRENYEIRGEALDRRLQLEDESNGGTESRPVLRSTTLSQSQLADAGTAFQEVGNRSLNSMIHKMLQIEGVAQEKGISVNNLLDFFSQHYRPSLQEITVYNAIESFIESRKNAGLYPKTVAYYRNSLNRLLKKDPNRMLHEVTLRELETILNSYKNLNSRRTRLRAFNTFFRWAKVHEHLLENPCSKIERVPLDDRKIQILPIEIVRKLLKSAMKWKDGEMVPALAIALFAGLRPSEIEALDSLDIRPNGIRVTGGKLRRSAKRIVPISENLQAWLKEYPFSEFPSHHRDSYRKLKKATGHKNWVQDVLRHTSISFQLALTNDVSKVATLNGTSTQMVHRHYLEIIDNPDDIQAFWNIKPDNLGDVSVEPPKLRGNKKVNWPSDKKLSQMVKDLPMTRVGKEIGVSDNAVRKHLKQRGLV